MPKVEQYSTSVHPKLPVSLLTLQVLWAPRENQMFGLAAFSIPHVSSQVGLFS